MLLRTALRSLADHLIARPGARDLLAALRWLHRWLANPDFYAAYVRDPDGHKLAVVCRGFTAPQDG